ncbi:hypothetical protein CR513_54240, partial [Mucuna pruriens]
MYGPHGINVFSSTNEHCLPAKELELWYVYKKPKFISPISKSGCGAALVNEKLSLTIVGITIVSGLALTVATYSVGHVSGGHFNPAVTIASKCCIMTRWILE